MSQAMIWYDKTVHVSMEIHAMLSKLVNRLRALSPQAVYILFLAWKSYYCLFFLFAFLVLGNLSEILHLLFLRFKAILSPAFSTVPGAMYL